MKTFEQPLSAEEENRYLSIMHGDDEAASHDARQILIERNLRLVAHVAKKYMGCGEDMEDLISIGTIGLIKPIGTDKEGNEINLIDVCEQEQTDVIEDMDMAAKLQCLYALIDEQLDERERRIIKLRYGVLDGALGGEELTQRDIGKLLGISRSYVSRIEKKALGKLKIGLQEAKLY